MEDVWSVCLERSDHVHAISDGRKMKTKIKHEAGRRLLCVRLVRRPDPLIQSAVALRNRPEKKVLAEQFSLDFGLDSETTASSNGELIALYSDNTERGSFFFSPELHTADSLRSRAVQSTSALSPKLRYFEFSCLKNSLS